MSVNSVCRLCLAIDKPMLVIAGSPLQDVYEKLTDVSLNRPQVSVVACSFCHCQLRKCHDLMVRSAWADKMLTQILQSRQVVNRESVAMINKTYQLHDALVVTPVELVTFTSTDLKNTDIKEEPLPFQNLEETRGDTIRKRLGEESGDEDDMGSTLDDMHDIEGQEIKDEEGIEHRVLDEAENIKDQVSEDAVSARECNQTLVENIQDESTLTPWEKNVEKPSTERTVTKEVPPSGTHFTYQLRSTKSSANSIRMSSDTFHSDTVINSGHASVKSINNSIATDTDLDSAGEDLKNSLISEDCSDVYDDEYLVESIKHHNVRNISSNEGGEEKSLRQSTMSRRKTYSRAHSQQNPLECDICKKKFTWVSTLKEHLRTHTKEKLFECEICQKRFTSKHRIRKHLKIHNGKKSLDSAISRNKFSNKGDAPDKKRVQVYVEKVEDIKTKLAGLNVQKRPITRRTIVEANTKASMLQGSERATNNRLGSLNISDTKMNKRNVRLHISDDISSRADIGNKYIKYLIRQFVCNKCNDVFDNKNLLIKHMECHNVGRRKTIRKSGVKSSEQHINKKFSRRAVVNKRTERRDKVFQCDICQQKFTLKGTLRVHMKIHTGVNDFECEICCQRLRYKCNLKAHLRTHTGEKPYECEICQRKFAQKFVLISHIRLHTGEKPFKCNLCPERFIANSYLSRHMNVHTGQLFECKTCSKKFPNKRNLNRHLKIHVEEKSIKCEICGNGFYRREHLNSHLKKHTGEKPYECQICKKRFSHKFNMNDHVKKHSAEKRFECNLCESRFTTNLLLQRHSQIHTGEKPFKCNICQRRFRMKRVLENHKRTHTGETPFECDVCKRQFSQKVSLNRHSKIHTGEKPFECDMCNQRFIQKGSLMAHLKKHSVAKSIEKKK